MNCDLPSAVQLVDLFSAPSESVWNTTPYCVDQAKVTCGYAATLYYRGGGTSWSQFWLDVCLASLCSGIQLLGGGCKEDLEKDAGELNPLWGNTEGK